VNIDDLPVRIMTVLDLICSWGRWSDQDNDAYCGYICKFFLIRCGKPKRNSTLNETRENVRYCNDCHEVYGVLMTNHIGISF